MDPYGPGWWRLIKRLGKRRAEALRQDTVKQQQEIRAKISGDRVEERDRTTYTDYPAPTSKRPRKK